MGRIRGKIIVTFSTHGFLTNLMIWSYFEVYQRTFLPIKINTPPSIKSFYPKLITFHGWWRCLHVSMACPPHWREDTEPIPAVRGSMSRAMSCDEARGQECRAPLGHEPPSGIICGELNIIDGETETPTWLIPKILESLLRGQRGWGDEEVQLLLGEIYLYCGYSWTMQWRRVYMSSQFLNT